MRQVRAIQVIPLRFITIVATIFFASAKGLAETKCPNCNVILISMDALQAKHVHHLGYNLDTTPTIDRLAKNGVSFSNAISPASWTVPTYLSIFTSTYPSVHGLTNRYEVFNAETKKVNDFKVKNPNLMTMAEVFRSNGYATGGFTGDAGVSAVLGYDKGFESYFDKVQFGGLDTSAEQALTWLKSVKTKSFFLFLHGYDQHGQYAVAPNYVSRFWDKSRQLKFKGTKEEQGLLREQGLTGNKIDLTDIEIEFWRAWYDGKIRDADERLQSFLKQIETLGLANKTIIVLLSDHGTEFFEHGRVDHGHTLYDELIHVPLVFSVPGMKNTGRIVSAQVSTLDVLPTLLSLTGAKTTPKLKKQMVGVDLSGPVLGKGVPQSRDAFSETDYRNYTHKRSIRTAEGWKYIMSLESGTEELYDLNKDPGEKTNLFGTKSVAKRAAILKSHLQGHLDKSLQSKGRNSATECLPVYVGQCVEKK